MSKSISILDKDYLYWLNGLCAKFRTGQIKAALKVNQEMLRFYWELGQDIASRQFANTYGSAFFSTLSADMHRMLPEATGFSPTTIKYAYYFYLLYSQLIKNRPQLGDDLGASSVDMLLENQLKSNIFSIPWGHHKLLIDKCGDNPNKALFFVLQTIENGWSRAMLLNFIDTDMYERHGKAMTNFKRTLPAIESDLAQEITKDPYSFAFTGITGRYNETELKKALIENITQFLIELGKGFAYIGREYRLQIGKKEKFADLLFYNLNLSCYVVIEVKIGEFDFADMGQLGGYIVACNHILRKEGRDNPTIGLLVCKQKDNLLAQYALESSNEPIGISEYELAQIYPEKVDGTIPTIEEIEVKLALKPDFSKH